MLKVVFIIRNRINGSKYINTFSLNLLSKITRIMFRFNYFNFDVPVNLSKINYNPSKNKHRVEVFHANAAV